MGSSREWVIGTGESRLGVQPRGHGVGVWSKISKGGFWCWGTLIRNDHSMVSGICISLPQSSCAGELSLIPRLGCREGAGSGPAGGGGCCRVVQICGGIQVGFDCVLSTKVQTEAPRMSVLGKQSVPRLGETSQQAHYRVERSQQNLEDKCRQVLR